MGETTINYQIDPSYEKSIQALCKKCKKSTNHKILSSYREDGAEYEGRYTLVTWNTHYQIIQCLGCETVSYRTVGTCSEDWGYDSDGNQYLHEDITYYPSRIDGLSELNIDLLPEKVQGIYEETVVALENGQKILSGIGIRALIETICKDKSANGKDLYTKIDWLKNNSIVTEDGAKTLHKLRILGNKAAHEVEEHPINQLSLALKIIDHMLDGTYIIPQKVQKVFK